MKLPKNKVVDRLYLIENRLKGKSVLHIGFTDAPFTRKKYEENSLFHIQIGNVCKELAGIDLDKESVDYLTSKGIKNIHTCDIYKLAEFKALSEFKFDYILFSEVIEHLPNASLALITIHEFIRINNPQAKVIITAPNINNFIFRFTDTIMNVERVHPDHYYYFSYLTLSKLITDTGFEIIDFKYVLYRNKNWFLLLLPKMLNIFSSSFMPYLFFEFKLNSNRK